MEAFKSRLKGEDMRGATRAEVDALKDENSKLRQVVADLSVENLTLKKASSETSEGTNEIREVLKRREVGDNL